MQWATIERVNKLNMIVLIVLTTLFTIGLINNNGYVMVAAGADTLATDFDH